MDVRAIYNITKEYPDMIKVKIFREPLMVQISCSPKRSKEIVKDETFVPRVSSLNRTKTLIRDLVLCNDFDLFCTFTFDPKKVDRFNLGRCELKMRMWLHHQADNSRERGKQFKYLIVPEEHKNGGWHFHALIAGYTGTLHDSKHFSASGRLIYNITSFRSGFTTAVAIDDKEKVSGYITKYITKDFIKKYNKRRFLSSRNLNRPIRTINSSIFRDTPPLFRKKVAENSEVEEFRLPVFHEYPTKSHQSYFDLISSQLERDKAKKIYF